MQTITQLDLTALPLSDTGIALTIGNFDGLHIAHQRLITNCVQYAKNFGLASAALTFEPHPLEITGKMQRDHRLVTSAEKSSGFEELSLDFEFRQSFDQQWRALNAREFAVEWLKKKLDVRVIFVGDDFRFGADRLGDVNLLSKIGREVGFSVSPLKSILKDGEAVRSSRIRTALLETGNVSLAAQFLGRPYLLSGIVVRGAQKGATIGFPTANLEIEPKLVPKSGVYRAEVWLESVSDSIRAPMLKTPERLIVAAVNIGMRPTVSSDGTKNIEAHLINHNFGSNELYGRKMSLYFTHYVRNEKKFGSIDELRNSIANDLKIISSFAKY